MEPKIREVQALVQESWQRFERHPQDAALIQPVKRGGQAEKAKVGNEPRWRSSTSAKTGPKSGSPQELAEEVQQYLEEVNVQLNFKIHEDTGELIVQVIDHDTNEVIRQIPSEQLIELREKLSELRGVLFSDKI